MDGPRSSTTSLPMTAAVVLARCPIGAWKHELIDGALYFQGWFNVRDITVAERAYLGRTVLVDSVSPPAGTKTQPSPGSAQNAAAHCAPSPNCACPGGVSTGDDDGNLSSEHYGCHGALVP
ncbi:MULTISPECIES: hypothetical protein [unclassified Streptomyces]|uniref:hypothetical protein n=1 Tax=unclassified Streptomyces TaxID=2593676 RepID=UPI00363D1ECA